ncbi:MAG: hypothetical protein IJ079_03880 [Lachnospiraceae bacterium]|nr:hypothetical protein [Lachnospiraceae bacterium]MBR1567548.1 hypothetical protein [Lachnospiraceae bacterium]MBR1568704.1 hypothetical protein [Lachnospiraceae bacterium]
MATRKKKDEAVVEKVTAAPEQETVAEPEVPEQGIDEVPEAPEQEADEAPETPELKTAEEPEVKKVRIMTKNQEFSGVRAGVTFVNGSAELILDSSKAVRAYQWFLNNGYQVEQL